MGVLLLVSGDSGVDSNGYLMPTSSDEAWSMTSTAYTISGSDAYYFGFNSSMASTYNHNMGGRASGALVRCVAQ